MIVSNDNSEQPRMDKSLNLSLKNLWLFQYTTSAIEKKMSLPQ